MTEQHPITPPLELLHQWTSFACEEEDGESWNSIATQAAQWGADQELEACKQYMHDHGWFMSPTLRMAELHNARRPKPPSLKEQAMEQLACIQTDLNKFGMGISTNTIRRALEQL
jgi:hypothetical protein